MIRKLRRKFILSTMAILVVLFAVVLGVLNYAFAQVGLQQTFDYLNQVALYQQLPALAVVPSSPATPFSGAQGDLQHSLSVVRAAQPIYGVYLDAAGNVTAAYAMNESAIGSADKALAAARKAAAKKRPQGSVGRWRYCRVYDAQGSFMALLDGAGSFESLMLGRLFGMSLVVSAGALVLLFFVSLWLSRFVTKPAEETFNQQKQFISDASHELKTPLSVIMLNAAVLSDEIGPSKYMDYIRSESRRMDGLIHQLLELSRMEDASRALITAPFDLSQALFEVALPFESTAFEHALTYDLQIAEGLRYTGEAESIKQLAAILLDNAFKHTPAGGSITCAARARGGDILLTVQNSGPGIAPEDLPHIFERFYRCDKARSQSGGYGLGLAIASSIAAAHGGFIRAQSEPGRTLFTVAL